MKIVGLTSYRAAIKLARRIAWHYMGKEIQVRGGGAARLDKVGVRQTKDMVWHVSLDGLNERGVVHTYISSFDEVRSI